jgi:hypothetical protein
LNSQKLIALGASAILALDASMLVLDERFSIFPLIFGLDLRYVSALGLVGFGVGITVFIRLIRRLKK